MRERFATALQQAAADYAEIRFTRQRKLDLNRRGGEPDASVSSTVARGMARACHRGGWGEVAFDGLAMMAEAVRKACRAARLVGTTRTNGSGQPGPVRPGAGSACGMFDATQP